MLKGKRSALRAVFSSWETVNAQAPAPMAEPFLAFAKSYFRYQHGFRPTKVIAFRIAAARALCAALAEQGKCDPTSVDVRIFNRAAQLIGTNYSASTAYRIGSQLEMLSSFMDDNRLAVLSLRWSNPLQRPQETTGRVGDEFEAVRQDKLPSPFVLDSLARAFQMASEPRDLVVTSVAALLCSAPDRINEVLALRAECEVHSTRPMEPPAYGLRFWPSKGADPMVKWVLPSMSSVVQEAVKRLRKISTEARELARWYEANPTEIFLPLHLEQLRGKDLTMLELNEVLFAEQAMPTSALRASASSWCVSNKVKIEKQANEKFVKFADVQTVVIRALPRGFPLLDAETGLRYRDALCIVRRNQLKKDKSTYRCIFEAVDQGFIATGLGNRSVHGMKSVFENLDLFEADGSPISIRTHQFRHYLNTLAQAGGMSELDIAKWSGRKDVRQNSTYNHVSDRDMQARLLELQQGGQNTSSTALVPQARISLIPREKFKEMGIQAAHTTDFGMCVHDFVMSPCQLHLDCNNCNEQVCIKGDALGEANSRAKHRETASLLAQAEAAEVDDYYGASRWVVHQRLTYDRLSELIAILDDPHVPQGAIIRLAHIKPASRLQHAVERRQAIKSQPIEQILLKWTVVENGSGS